MAYVHQTCKKTGITYVYENKPYWDKEKKQSRAKRKLVGKLHPETGEIVPTRDYNKKEAPPEQTSKPGPKPISQTHRSFYGATYLLNEIGRITGVEEDLKSVFPKRYKQILSIAYFLVMEDSNALSRFPHWSRLHVHPYGKSIPSQRSSELFQSITEEERMGFFTKQAQRRIENEYWAFDTTSISSYSDALAQVKNGKNKEGEHLAQLNVALLFGEQSGLPFYYRKLPGNITDVKILKQLLNEFDWLGIKKIKVVLDRGFYSRENINACFTHHQKFLVGVSVRLKYVREAIDEAKGDLEQWCNLYRQYNTYGMCKTLAWDYEYERPRIGDTVKEKRRAYLLIYYNADKAAQEEINFNQRMNELYDDLINGNRRPYREKDYSRYFSVTETPKRGRKVVPKEDAMKEAKRYFGYFAFLSNEVKDPEMTLAIYRSRDIVEKAFGDLKERLNMRRFQVSSELSLNGKLFVEFIALIYTSYIKKAMQDAKLFEKWTLHGLLDELDLIEVLEAPGHGRILGEVTRIQAGLFDKLQVETASL